MAQEHSLDAAYFGDRAEWVIAYAQHRDSDTITRSNWAVFLAALGGESDTVAIERSTHWAVGWIDYLIIDPSDTERVGLAERLREKLEDYPVLDEMEWSNLEWDEYLDAWSQWGRSDFVRALKREFGLSDAAVDLLDEAEDLQAFYEANIPSGEYYIAEGSGVSLNTDYAAKRCSRIAMGQYLRQLRG